MQIRQSSHWSHDSLNMHQFNVTLCVRHLHLFLSIHQILPTLDIVWLCLQVTSKCISAVYNEIALIFLEQKWDCQVHNFLSLCLPCLKQVECHNMCRFPSHVKTKETVKNQSTHLTEVAFFNYSFVSFVFLNQHLCCSISLSISMDKPSFWMTNSDLRIKLCAVVSPIKLWELLKLLHK